MFQNVNVCTNIESSQTCIIHSIVYAFIRKVITNMCHNYIHIRLTIEEVVIGGDSTGGWKAGSNISEGR